MARAAHAALEAYAAECTTPGDTRTKDQRMADCLAELILRPGTNPPVQIELTLLAGADTMTGGDTPGELAGHPLPAELVRELAYTLGLLPRPMSPPNETTPAEETGPAEEGEPAAGPSPAKEIDQTADTIDLTEEREATEPAEPADLGTADVADRQARRRELADLLSLHTLTGTALTSRPHIAVVDAVTGCLLALTDARTLRTGAPVGPPPDSPGYTPRADLARFIRLRDKRCRFPGCRARAKRCDLDHKIPWPAGPTSHTNLCCLCEHHHRLKTHAPGWTIRPLPDGGLQWTTPSGDTFVTHPPGFGTDDEPTPVRTAAGTALTPEAGPPQPPPQPPPPEDDPAPF